MDELDFKIFHELQRDGRLSSAEIARTTGTSISSVRRRIARMVSEDNVQIVAVPDPIRFGYNSWAFIGLETNCDSLDRVCDKLVDHPNVHLVALSSGRYNIVIGVHFKTSQELASFLKRELPAIEGVVRTETHTFIETRKRTMTWLRVDVPPIGKHDVPSGIP